MHASIKQPRIWIGHWLMFVALLHTSFAALVFGRPLLDMARSGLFNSLGDDPMRGLAVWFALFGAGLALLALAITPLERGGQAPALKRLGWGLLALALVGLYLMPASGFWLALPAAIALIRAR